MRSNFVIMANISNILHAMILDFCIIPVFRNRNAHYQI